MLRALRWFELYVPKKIVERLITLLGFEPLDDWPEAERAQVKTDTPDRAAAIAAVAARIEAGHGLAGTDPGQGPAPIEAS